MINITDIQHFSIGDGDGIRTTIFTKGCNLHCPWCHNPETILDKKQILNYVVGDKICPKECGIFLDEIEILKEILQDKDFYLESGGGVTISGGECMLQANNLARLLKEIKKENIHIIIDTAGNINYKEFEKINNYVDEYYYDIKTADKDSYKEVIGGNLNLIIDNYKNLIKDNKKVKIRIPLIPMFNSKEEDIKKIIELLKLLNVNEVDLLPFHRLGISKYKALGLDYKYKNVKPFLKEELDNIEKIYSKYFKIKIEK